MTTAGSVASPVFSLAAGTFNSNQITALSDSTQGTAIYYTTNGATPTAQSTLYTGSITIAQTETIQAVAILNGIASSVSSATYIINPGSACTTAINFADGFNSKGLTLNHGAKIVGTTLQLTDGGTNENRSAFFTKAVSDSSFLTSFNFQLLKPNADGFTFVVQGNAPNIYGASGAGLGYAGIGNSVAIKFDLYNNSGEGNDSTGLYYDGASPTVPAIDLSATGINLHSGHIFNTQIAYNGANATITITDTMTGASYSFSQSIPGMASATGVYVGFTGSSGSLSASQSILSWTYSEGSSCAAQ